MIFCWVFAVPELQGEPEDISKEKARLAAIQVLLLLIYIYHVSRYMHGFLLWMMLCIELMARLMVLCLWKTLASASMPSRVCLVSASFLISLCFLFPLFFLFLFIAIVCFWILIDCLKIQCRTLHVSFSLLLSPGEVLFCCPRFDIFIIGKKNRIKRLDLWLTKRIMNWASFMSKY